MYNNYKELGTAWILASTALFTFNSANKQYQILYGPPNALNYINCRVIKNMLKM